ncbi:MAG: glycosyltransferase [Erythrobacter sp.]|nr:glycosyltransferase [Erythrobacter sp.]
MKIAVVGHIRHAIAPPFMGGMEAHCHHLVQALEHAGHDVTLFAARGSKAQRLVEICDEPYETKLPWARWRGTPELAAFQRDVFARTREGIKRGGFDVVHNNSLSPDLIDDLREARIPTVTSHHVPPFAAIRSAVARARDALAQVFTVTSGHQLSLWDKERGTNMQVVSNGIELADWPQHAQRSDRVLWFGRIASTKGLREAVAAVRLAGAKLDVVGTIEEADYYAEHVEPYLGDDIRYLGHLAGEDLRSVVAQARAVLVTPMWDEPFGLVAAEAMACAVPVIAFDRGAMREILGPCGVIVPAGDVEALAAAIAEADTLDGEPCRERIARLFSTDRMIAGYERAYRQAISGADLLRRVPAMAAVA